MINIIISNNTFKVELPNSSDEMLSILTDTSLIYFDNQFSIYLHTLKIEENIFSILYKIKLININILNGFITNVHVNSNQITALYFIVI
jgi:hypothetical protein